MGIQGLGDAETQSSRRRKRESSRDSEDREFCDWLRDDEEWGDDEYEDESSESASDKESKSSNAEEEGKIASGSEVDSEVDSQLDNEDAGTDDLDLSIEHPVPQDGSSVEAAPKLRTRKPVKYFVNPDLEEEFDEVLSDNDNGNRRNGSRRPLASQNQSRSRVGTENFAMNTRYDAGALTDDEEMKSEPTDAALNSRQNGSPKKAFAVENRKRRWSSSDDDREERKFMKTDTSLSDNGCKLTDEEILQQARKFIGEEILDDYETKHKALAKLNEDLELKVLGRGTFGIKDLECRIRGQTLLLQMVKDQNIAKIKERMLENIDRVEEWQRLRLRKLCETEAGVESSAAVLWNLEQMDFLDRVHLLGDTLAQPGPTDQQFGCKYNVKIRQTSGGGSQPSKSLQTKRQA